MVSLGERVDSPVLFLQVTFGAGDDAAPARSPKPPRRCGAGGVLLADAAAEVEDVDQFFDETDDHGGHVVAPLGWGWEGDQDSACRYPAQG